MEPIRRCADAAALGVRDGERVRLLSRHGRAELPANLDRSVRPGEPCATFHTGEAFLNRVTSPRRDGRTGTPEYKVTAVRVEKLSGG